MSGRKGWKCHRYGLCMFFLGDDKLLWFIRQVLLEWGDTAVTAKIHICIVQLVFLFLGFLLLKCSLVGEPEWCWLGHFDLVVVELGMWLLYLLETWYESQCSVVKKWHNDVKIYIFGNVRTYWNLLHDCWANGGENRKKLPILNF